MTARDLITDILQDLNVVGSGETSSDHDAHFALRRLNRWIDSLALENLALYYVLRTVQTLTSGTPSYTIGTGGVINIVRPDHIDKASLILDQNATPQTEIPIAVFTDQEWENLRQKTLTSPLAQGIYYDRNWVAGLGTISPYPVPSVSTTRLVLYTLQALTQFADLNTVYTLPPGYDLFLETNVLELLASSFGKAVTQDQAHAASETRRKLKRANARPVVIAADPALRPELATFDYRTGEVR